MYCKVSENSSANNELVAKTFRICKNFLVSIADALTVFLRLCHQDDVGPEDDAGPEDYVVHEDNVGPEDLYAQY